MLTSITGARRARRLVDIDRFDAIYGAYLAGVALVVATVVGTTFVPDAQVDAATVEKVARDGGAWIGLALALIAAVGCRSGGRGGPLALEAPVVQHVLLAPISRSLALRGPAWRQLRFSASVGASAGAVSGLLAARRLPGPLASYLACGAVTGALVAVLTIGAALVISGHRAPMWAADGAAAVLVAVSVLDVSAGLRFSPLTHLGLISLTPLGATPLALVGVGFVAAVVWAGLRAVGGSSLEAAQRRAGLVGQLRFAATLQDLRTVVLLRRQLAQEHPRTTPWISLRSTRVADRFPITWRSAQGVARFPAARVARMITLGVAAGGAMRGVWSGTTPLLVVAALALFVAGLDAIEPLSQEIDRPDRWASFPLKDGTVLLHHLVVPTLVMVLVGLIAVSFAVALDPSALAIKLGLVVVPGVAVAAVAGAAGSVVMGPPDTLLRVQLPEAAGTSMIFRVVWPPGLVAVALAPVVAARTTSTAAPLDAAINLEVLLLFPLLVVLGWLSTRKARLP